MGLFITIEGPEGAGKSTLQKNLARLLRESGESVIETREPGGTALGKSIREILLNPTTTKLAPKAELLLFLVDRAHHILEVISPALERGDFVICDRFIHSTIAYQGYGRGMDLEKLKALNDFTIGKCKPDLVLLLDLDPGKGLERVSLRSKANADKGAPTRDRFEQEEEAFHQRVRKGFKEMAAENPAIFVVLDATKPVDLIAQEAYDAVLDLKQRKFNEGR